MPNDTRYTDVYNYTTKRYDEPLADQVQNVLVDIGTVLENVTAETRTEPYTVPTTAALLKRLNAIREQVETVNELLAGTIDSVEDLTLQLDQTVRQIETERDALGGELFNANELVEALSPRTAAATLHHELRGRISTDSPADIVAWIDSALQNMANGVGVNDAHGNGVNERTEPRTVSELNTLMAYAVTAGG